MHLANIKCKSNIKLNEYGDKALCSGWPEYIFWSTINASA